MRAILSFVLVLSLAACTQTQSIDEKARLKLSPKNWHSDYATSTTVSVEPWYQHYATVNLDDLVTQALQNNFQLKQLKLATDIQAKRLNIAQADLWPSLSIGFNASRQKSSSQISNSTSLELSGSYELDIWGKLSAKEQSNLYQFLSAKALYEQARQQLVADVLIGYAQAIEAEQLYQLFTKRSQNTQQNLDIIESGYKGGLNSALDVYLSRNELNSDLAQVFQQEATRASAIRDIENLLGKYPSGLLSLSESIPNIDNKLQAWLPSDLILNKPSLQSKWLDLLAANSDLAFAHKQRFPSFNISASIGNSEEKLKDLLSSDIVWSVLGSVVAPIFNAGSLAATEDIARLTKEQVELTYMEQVYQSFSEVENAMLQEKILRQRYDRFLEAEKNAIAAEELAFEQYLKGLVSYTTVLDAQTRAVDAQSALIQIKRQLFTNRIQLHVALGGSFDDTNSISEVNNDQI